MSGRQNKVNCEEKEIKLFILFIDDALSTAENT
jgi:hypothetical protein